MNKKFLYHFAIFAIIIQLLNVKVVRSNKSTQKEASQIDGEEFYFSFLSS